MHLAKKYHVTLHCDVVVECSLGGAGGCIIALVTPALAISTFAQPQSGDADRRGEQRIKTKTKTKTRPL